MTATPGSFELGVFILHIVVIDLLNSNLTRAWSLLLKYFGNLSPAFFDLKTQTILARSFACFKKNHLTISS
jgi:hypothetical protein